MSKPNVTPAMLLKKYSAKEDRAELAGLVGVAEALEMRMCALVVLSSAQKFVSVGGARLISHFGALLLPQFYVSGAH